MLLFVRFFFFGSIWGIVVIVFIMIVWDCFLIVFFVDGMMFVKDQWKIKFQYCLFEFLVEFFKYVCVSMVGLCYKVWYIEQLKIEGEKVVVVFLSCSVLLKFIKLYCFQVGLLCLFIYVEEYLVVIVGR